MRRNPLVSEATDQLVQLAPRLAKDRHVLLVAEPQNVLDGSSFCHPHGEDDLLDASPPRQ